MSKYEEILMKLARVNFSSKLLNLQEKRTVAFAKLKSKSESRKKDLDILRAKLNSKEQGEEPQN